MISRSIVCIHLFIQLPSGAVLDLNFTVPYEARIVARNEELLTEFRFIIHG